MHCAVDMRDYFRKFDPEKPVTQQDRSPPLWNSHDLYISCVIYDKIAAPRTGYM